MEETKPTWTNPPFIGAGPNSPGTMLHRKVVNGGNPYFTPHEANISGLSLPDVQPLRGAPTTQ